MAARLQLSDQIECAEMSFDADMRAEREMRSRATNSRAIAPSLLAVCNSTFRGEKHSMFAQGLGVECSNAGHEYLSRRGRWHYYGHQAGDTFPKRAMKSIPLPKQLLPSGRVQMDLPSSCSLSAPASN